MNKFFEIMPTFSNVFLMPEIKQLVHIHIT